MNTKPKWGKCGNCTADEYWHFISTLVKMSNYYDFEQGKDWSEMLKVKRLPQSCHHRDVADSLLLGSSHNNQLVKHHLPPSDKREKLLFNAVIAKDDWAKAVHISQFLNSYKSVTIWRVTVILLLHFLSFFSLSSHSFSMSSSLSLCLSFCCRCHHYFHCLNFRQCQ